MNKDKKVCRLSVVGLFAGLVGIFPAAIICGHLALRKIKKNHQSGKLFAVGGLILGYIFCLVFLFLVFLFATAQPINSVTTPEIIRMLEEEESITDVYIFEAGNIRIKLKDGTEYNGQYIHKDAGKFSSRPDFSNLHLLLEYIKRERNAKWQIWMSRLSTPNKCLVAEVRTSPRTG